MCNNVAEDNGENINDFDSLIKALVVYEVKDVKDRVGNVLNSWYIQKPNVVLSLLKVGCRRMGGAVVGGGGRGASTHPRRRRRRRRGRRGTQEEKEEEHPSEEEEAEHEETEAQLLSSRQHKRRPLSDRRPRYPSSAKTMPLSSSVMLLLPGEGEFLWPHRGENVYLRKHSATQTLKC